LFDCSEGRGFLLLWAALTEPSIHRQAQPAPPLKYCERRLHRRSLYIHTSDTQIYFVTGCFPSLYDRTCNAGLWPVADTAMYRVKQLFGGSLTLRDYDGQVAEALTMVRGLNRMTKESMPVSVPIA